MNKKILIGILVIFLIVISVAIIKFVSKNDGSKQLELTYDINAGIPFKWEVEVEDESIVKYVKNYVIEDENKGGLVGGKVSRNYVFKGLKKGTTTIVFKSLSTFTICFSSFSTLPSVKLTYLKTIVVVPFFKPLKT